MPLIYCEFNLMVTWSENCFLVPGAVANQMPLFTLSYTKLYVAVETLSSHNAKVIEELKSGQSKINLQYFIVNLFCFNIISV